MNQNPFGAFGGMGMPPGGFAMPGMGMGMPDPNTISQMMSNPMVQQMMSNPEFID